MSPPRTASSIFGPPDEDQQPNLGGATGAGGEDNKPSPPRQAPKPGMLLHAHSQFGTAKPEERVQEQPTTFRKGMPATWLPAPNKQYTASIIVANQQQNKNIKLEALLDRAVETGCCLVIVSEGGFEGDGDSKAGKYFGDELKRRHGPIWNIHFRGHDGSRGERSQGFIIFARGGWQLNQLEVLTAGRAMLIRGTDPGRNAISIVAMQC